MNKLIAIKLLSKIIIFKQTKNKYEQLHNEKLKFYRTERTE